LARIRLAYDSDAEAIASIYRPVVETTAISFETIPPDREEIARRITETLVAYPWLVCELEGQVAGYAYAARHQVRTAYQWSVDTSIYVDGQYRQCGIGRGLYVSLFGMLGGQGFFNAYAGIALPNGASVALHEALGFKKIGLYARAGYKLGTWHDVGWWQLTLKAHTDSPEQPLDLAGLKKHSEWKTLLTSGESFIRAKASCG
jgi:L-amino acid N-acyltransferase YncA